MANFHSGGYDTFSAVTHAAPHPNTLNFIQDVVNTPTQAISNTAQQFLTSAKDSYNQLMGSEAMRAIRAAKRQIGAVWNSNEIKALNTVEDLQQAPIKMQRFIMAEPNIRTMYHQGMCDGYHETYKDIEPDKVGADHYDYRRVTNGMVMQTDSGWEHVNYYESLKENDQELLVEEQVDVMKSWRVVKAQIEKAKDYNDVDDPTSRWNARL